MRVRVPAGSASEGFKTVYCGTSVWLPCTELTPR